LIALSFAIRYNNLTQFIAFLNSDCGADCGARMTEKRKKSAKGTVVVQVFRDRLRLCWTFEGNRLYLYLGLPDSAANRKVAEMRARQIELDIASGNFDRTLAKYKPQSQRVTLTVCDLFQRFTDWKSKRVDPRTLEKYRALQGHLFKHFGQRAAGEVGEAQAEKFREWLGDKLELGTLKEWLGLLRAAWDWAIKQKVLLENPWGDVAKSIKVPPKQKPKPFSGDEIERILEGFRTGDYAHYADFVEFLLGTGCRTGEAIALQWQHLSDDCSAVWIGESMSRGGRRKATKTNKARIFGLSPRLQQMLQARKPANCKPDDLVFPAPKGGAIDDHNFRNRAWAKVLEQAGVEYRKPYITRSTFESQAIIEHGMNPAIVADITGHDPKTLFKHYLGRTGGLQTPDITSGKR